MIKRLVCVFAAGGLLVLGGCENMKGVSSSMMSPFTSSPLEKVLTKAGANKKQAGCIDEKLSESLQKEDYMALAAEVGKVATNDGTFMDKVKMIDKDSVSFSVAAALATTSAMCLAG